MKAPLAMKGNTRRGKGIPSNGHGRKDKGETFIVKVDGKSYADVLKALRGDKKLTGLGDDGTASAERRRAR